MIATQHIRIAPPNSLLYISDSRGGTVPEWKRGAPILSSPSCISFSCLTFADGETDVTVGAASDVDPGVRPAFDGSLETPSRTLELSTVERNTVMQTAVPAESTRVRIWTNHPTEPDKVIVGLD